jgi:UDP-N-acetylglucosamine 2-epimerase (non-hydrolysing)
MPLIDLIAGARPNFMKVAPIIHALHRRFGPPSADSALTYRLVHTGQHYDRAMSGAFFEQLGIPEPHVNLEAGSGTQAEQTAAIMTRYEALLAREPADLCLVVGDVTSTLACAIVARKAGIPVAHVEGGIRSGDWSMPEEINRVVTDSLTNWFFTTSETANANLRRAGVTDDRIFFVGNTMIDTLLVNRPRFQPPPLWTEAGLQPGSYFVLTLHRPANVDDPATLGALLDAIQQGTRGLPVVFPIHPRTRKVLTTLPPVGTRSTASPILPLPQPPQAPGPQSPPTLQRSNAPTSLLLSDPLGYLEFNYLVQHAKAVITDSGGITEETTVLGVPCLTLRDNTERPETITHGTNELIGTDPANLGPALDRLFAGQWKRGAIPDKWDGHTGDRIIAALEQLLSPR